jgi:hypothetical protein
LFAQKKEEEKGTPFHRPSGYLALLTVVRKLKNSATPQTVSTSFSSNSCDAQRERMGYRTNKY